MDVNAATAARATEGRGPRVCLCILMNHPYPRNLPLLREIYLGRFSKLLFLMPFERLDDRDVITVYRGSYTHAGYITDARRELDEVDCDYFIFCHDDVLLNPQLNERSFPEIFPLGPNDGYISRAGPLPTYMGGWDWYFGLIPKMYHPKSLLFGSGVEYSSLIDHLPPPAIVEAKLFAAGMGYVTDLRLSKEHFTQIEKQPSRVVVHGHNVSTDVNEARQDQIERLSLNICGDLVDVLKVSSELAGKEHLAEDGSEVVDLPIPLVASGYFSDLYILPKSRLADYAHYVGVASAANLFVEVFAPTLLFTCCDRVWQASELGLDDTGFERPAIVEEFADRSFLAIHPFKMSRLTHADKRALLTTLRTLAGEPDPKMPVAQPGGVDGNLIDFDSDDANGWHGPEPWGAWAAEAVATVKFYHNARTSIQGAKVHICIPVHHSLGRLSGWVTLNGAEQRITAEWPETCVTVDFSAAELQPGAVNLVEVKTDRMLRPAEIDPALANDARRIGLGLRGVTFL